MFILSFLLDRPLRFWPDPVPKSERYLDDARGQRLQAAFDIAADVLVEAEFDCDTRAMLETRRLAALALDDDLCEEAGSMGFALL